MQFEYFTTKNILKLNQSDHTSGRCGVIAMDLSLIAPEAFHVVLDTWVSEKGFNAVVLCTKKWSCDCPGTYPYLVIMNCEADLYAQYVSTVQAKYPTDRSGV